MTAAQLSINAHHRQLKKLIKEAKKLKDMYDKKKFLSDFVGQKAICYTLQMMIEAALTIGEMIIAMKGFDRAEKNDDIFPILAKEKVITRLLEEKLWGVGGFRNILAHNYVTLDLNKTYQNLELSVPAMNEYAIQIAKFLIKKK